MGESNLGFDPICDAAAARDLCQRQGGEPQKPEILSARSSTSIPKSRRDAVPGLHHGDRAVALHRYPMAEETGAKTGRARARRERPLPRADVLVVTWTVDEGHALSRVLTPGKDSHNDYLSYTHNFATISKKMRKGCPALEAKRLGAYWTTNIGGKSVVVFKSDSHMSQDGPQLPNIEVWRQIIHEVRPKLVITTGTAGGIGTDFEVGDVIVSPIVRFDCTAKFKKREPFAQEHYASAAAKTHISPRRGCCSRRMRRSCRRTTRVRRRSSG